MICIITKDFRDEIAEEWTDTWALESNGLYLELVFFVFVLCVYVCFREREEGREKIETSTCCSTYLCIHLLIPICALTGDWTCNLGILGRCSNQLSYPAKWSWSLMLTLNVAIDRFPCLSGSISSSIERRWCHSQAWEGRRLQEMMDVKS